MKVEKINKQFKKIGTWQIRHRVAITITILLLGAIGFAGLSRAYTSNARADWFEDDAQIEKDTAAFEAEFGNNQNITVLVEADDVFDPRVLKMIQELGQELLDNVPYADEITSLTDAEIAVGTESGMLIVNPFEDGIPSESQKIEEIRNLIFSRHSMADKIVSRDSKETWLSLALREYPDEAEWKKETNKDPQFQAGEVAIKIVTDPKWQSDLYTLKPVGMPYTETEERNFVKKEMMTRLLGGMLVMIVLLAFFVRKFWGVVVASVSAIGGLLTVFGYMSWLKIGINTNMVFLPLLLGMALSVGYSVHMINSFKRELPNCVENKEAAIAAVEKTGWPLFFTVITTVASLLSFVSVGTPSITWAGLTSASVVIANWFFVATLIPIFLSYGKKREDVFEHRSVLALQKLMQKTGEFILRRKTAVLTTAVVVFFVVLPGVFKISVNMDVFEMMGRRIPYINRVYEITQSQLGSYLSYNVCIKYQEPNKIKDPQVMKNFDTFTREVGKLELTKKNKTNVSVFSILDILKEMNLTLHGENPDYYKVPDSSDMIAQLLLLYEISGGTKLFRWIDQDYSMMRLQVQVEKFNANEVARELNKTKELGKELFPGAKVSIIGSVAEFAEMNKMIVLGELKSLGLSLLFISILLILVFGSFSTGLIGMVPNIFPLLVLGGYMGYMNSSLDMMTMTIMPMLLGIAVDDTIHFINHIKYQFELHGNYAVAIVHSFKEVGTTLAMTTIILIFSFVVYMPSPMNAMARIGILSVLGFTAALFADYFITPILISYTKPFGKEKN